MAVAFLTPTLSLYANYQAGTTKWDALKQNKYNKICTVDGHHFFHRPRLNGGFLHKLETPIYGPCVYCVADEASNRIKHAYKFYAIRLARRAENIRLAQETHNLYLEKLNDVYEYKYREFQLAAEAAQREIQLRGRFS